MNYTPVCLHFCSYAFEESITRAVFVHISVYSNYTNYCNHAIKIKFYKLIKYECKKKERYSCEKELILWERFAKDDVHITLCYRHGWWDNSKLRGKLTLKP